VSSFQNADFVADIAAEPAALPEEAIAARPEVCNSTCTSDAPIAVSRSDKDKIYICIYKYIYIYIYIGTINNQRMSTGQRNAERQRTPYWQRTCGKTMTKEHATPRDACMRECMRIM
jgi:hypothetical protein